jgi:uncharacterized MAPEG superfamily protein
MTPELTALALAALLQTLQFALMAIPVNLELGPKLTASPRDGMNLASMVSPKTARLVRALNNHFEALILFTIAVLVVTLSNQSTPTTHYAAYTYLAARTLYVPAYYFGWQPWRSAIWGVGFMATVTMLLSTLL